MKAVLLLLLAASAFAQGLPLGGIPAAAAPACSTPAQGNLLAEGFQTATTGYEVAGWATVNGTPNPAYDSTALSTNKPNGACNQAFQSNKTTAATYQNAGWDSGSNRASTVYMRFYLYVVTEAFDSNWVTIAGVYNEQHPGDGGYSLASIAMEKSGATLRVWASGATSSAKVNLAAGWNLIEMKVVPNGASAIKVNSGAEQAFTATGYTNWRTISIGNSYASDHTYTTNSSVFDLVALDSADWIGATP